MTYPTKKLWEIAKYINWKAFKPSDWKIEGLPIVRIQNLNWKNTYNYFDGDIEDKYVFNNWDILISWSASLDVYIWNWWKAVLNQHIFKVEIDENIVNKQFFYYLIKNSLAEIIHNTHWVWMKHITKWNFEKIETIFPPLSTQKLIVQKLDIAFKNIDESINITKNNIANIEELNKSILEWIYTESKFNEIELWNKDYLEIVDWDRWKQYPKKSEFTEKGFCLFLNTSNVRKWFFKFEKLDFITKEKYNLLWKWKAYKNDIILTTRWTIWNTALVEDDFPYEKIRINSWMVILRNNLDLLFPKYLIHFINSSNFNNQKNSLVSWSAQPQLPIWVMKQIKIPLPPLEKQKEIVSYLDEVFEKNKVIKEWYENKLKDLEEMKQSILKEAFEWRLIKE